MPADIEINCPGCGVVLSAPEEMAGETVECPECKTEFSVPAAESGTGASTDGARCPSCGSEVQPDAVLCLECGYHFKLGRKISTEFQ